MNAPLNGSLKKIVIGVATALVLGLIARVTIDANRITILETELQAFEKAASSNKEDLKQELLRNRTDNDEQHKAILAMIKEVRDDLKARSMGK